MIDKLLRQKYSQFLNPLIWTKIFLILGQKHSRLVDFLAQRYSRFVNILIFIFPIVIISLQVAGDIVLFTLAMMGIYISISQKLSPFIVKEIKVYSYLTIGYFIAVCLSVIFSGKAAELAHFIPRDLYFIFAPFIALALYKAKINFDYLLVGTKISLLILGVIIMTQLFSGVHRPAGLMNAGVFGNLAVLLFFIVLVFSQYESFIHKLFTTLSLFSGFFIIIASGTRGAWLSFIFLLGIYLYFLYKQKVKLRKKLKIIMALIVVSLLSIGSFNESVNQRLDEAYTQTSKWVGGDTDLKIGDGSINPISERLAMYRAAINNIKDVPFFGHGYRTSNIVLFKNDMGDMGKIAVNYNHLHNAYLTSYYNGGIVLLGALLFILFVPLKVFIKANSQDRENPIFISGVLLTLGYASIGMVSILLGDTYMNGFYVFFLAIFLLLTYKSIKVP